jgi:hypothetical protein
LTIFATPEEAARGDVPVQFVRVVGVVVRGDSAVVAQLTNDGPYEVETAYCKRKGNGWACHVGGNSTSGYIPTDERSGTVVVWDEAPAGATAARFEYEGREQVVAVENGCGLAVFDDVAEDDADGPRLTAWIFADGTEQALPLYTAPESMRTSLRGGRGIYRQGGET